MKATENGKFTVNKYLDTPSLLHFSRSPF